MDLMVLESIRCSIRTIAIDMVRVMWPERTNPNLSSSGGWKRSIQSSFPVRRLSNRVGITTTKSTGSPQMRRKPKRWLMRMMRTHPSTEKKCRKHSNWLMRFEKNFYDQKSYLIKSNSFKTSLS